MKLYTSLASPYGRKVHVLALEKGIELDIEWVKSPYVSVARLNPLGQVPTFERDDGTILFDSAVIIEDLDARSGPSLHGETEARIAIGVWDALADGLIDATVKRMLELRREPAQQSPAVVRHAESKIKRSVDYAERRIGGEQAFLVGGAFSLADIALCCAIDYLDLRYRHAWRDRCPQLASMHERLASRPSLAQTRPPAPNE